MNRSMNSFRRRSTHAAGRGTGGVVAFVMMVATTGAAQPARPTGQAASVNRSPATRTMVDSAVRPAGGMACQQCGPGGCQQGKHGHHRDCRDGACVPYCPVRPGTFGYYGTQWRRWPGQGVVPVSNVEAATPVKPPKSEVPGIDEESLGPKPSELPQPPATDGGDAQTPARPLPPEPDASPVEAQPSAPEPRVVDPAPSKPADVDPAPSKPGSDDLFDQSAAPKVRRRIQVQSNTPVKSPAEPSGVKAASHESESSATEPPRRTVPRVAFDPRSESARLREPR